MTNTCRVIYTKMVADLFHYGHVQFLEHARSLGDRLVVHVVSDQRVQAYKRVPVMTQSERAKVVAACRFVDEIRLEGPKEITPEFLTEHGYVLYAFGFADERERIIKLKDCHTLSPDQLAFVPYTQGISTTEIIDRVLKNSRT